MEKGDIIELMFFGSIFCFFYIRILKLKRFFFDASQFNDTIKYDEFLTKYGYLKTFLQYEQLRGGRILSNFTLWNNLL